MNISKLSDAAKITTTNEICDGIKNFIKNNPETVDTILDNLVTTVLEPLAEDDFWGAEGWEHAFGIE